MPLLIERDDLPGSAQAHQFVGAEHGNVPVSFFLVHSSPGEGPAPHAHPYDEVFVVNEGEASFELDGNEVAAKAGDIVIAPADTPHRFTNTGAGELRLTAIHPAPVMVTEWLDGLAGPATRGPSSPWHNRPGGPPGRPRG